jgi:CubicO group peptidase (beta-lactamase class C family)
MMQTASSLADGVYPGATWQFTTPAEVGMDSAKLDIFRDYVGGRGCVARYGYMAYTWGDQTYRQDVASACKPFFSFFLFKAVKDGRLASLDDLVVNWEPCINNINSSLGYKDRGIKFRHMANQISCYGVRENPGTAFDYNDWQMALFWDTLFLRVYGTTYADVDTAVYHPMLTDILQCQDNPTMLAFGSADRPGRVRVSVRDFARFGLLYLRKGNWNGTQLISQATATMAVTSPVPLSIPRTAGQAAEMCPNPRSIGSGDIPDNQTDHNGSYSWLWWINGITRTGGRYWPDVPVDTFGAFGHSNGQRAVAAIPSLELVVSWNDTTLGSKPGNPNEALKLLVAAVVQTSPLISLSTHTINRTADYGHGLGDDAFTVANGGAGTLSYSVSVNQSWLAAAPSNGSSTGEADQIVVSYDVDGLAVGRYVATIEVRDDGSSPPAVNSPQTITVTVDVKTVLPDLDLDTDVDQEDFGRFQACLSGQDTPPPSCLDADFNHNGLVDQLDFAVFLECFSGPAVPADVTCDDAYQ